MRFDDIQKARGHFDGMVKGGPLKPYAALYGVDCRCQKFFEQGQYPNCIQLYQQVLDQYHHQPFYRALVNNHINYYRYY